MPKAGIVTVVGKPNAGKSTLLNRIVGEKLSIVSPKPQSTRDRIVGIHTADDVQMILLDTPGLLNPQYPLQQSMRSTALAALHEADVILYLVDGTDGGMSPSLLDVAAIDRPPRAPVVLAVNKIDLLNDGQRAELLARNPDASFISATTGDGVDALLSRLGGIPAGESVPVSRRRDQHADRPLLRRRARSRNRARAAGRRSALQRRLRDRGVS